MNDFKNYSDIIWDAFNIHIKKTELVDRKKEILDKILEYYNSSPRTYLFLGFSPLIFTVHESAKVVVGHCSPNTLNEINKQRVISEFNLNDVKKFDCVVATDEFFTFAKSEEDQKSNIFQLCNLTNDVLITTVKDYKNQDFKEREFSSPAIIKTQSTITAFTEIHNWDSQDKNKWQTAVYQLQSEEAKCRGLFDRRTLYFKQLAKFTSDFGANDFLVHKNLMYKSLIKKNYEHVISVKFDK